MADQAANAIEFAACASTAYLSQTATLVCVTMCHYLKGHQDYGKGTCSVVLPCAMCSQIFTHVAEYLGRDCLDLLVCVDVAAAAVDAAGGTGPALQLLLAGAAQGQGGSAGANGSGSSSSSNGGGACCYVINDVNLLTVLETVRLLMDYSS